MLAERHFIRRNQITNFKPAVRLAEKRGTPLNQLVTINFAHTDITDRQVPRAFTKLRTNLFNPWYRRPRAKIAAPAKSSAFVWVQEAAGGVTTVHWLVHVRDHRIKDFKARLPLWLARVAGEVSEGAIDVRPAYKAIGAVAYMSKGIDPGIADFYGIRAIDQGLTYGKRAGFSASLGPSQCREARTYWTQMEQDRLSANDTGRARSTHEMQAAA